MKPWLVQLAVKGVVSQAQRDSLITAFVIHRWMSPPDSRVFVKCWFLISTSQIDKNVIPERHFKALCSLSALLVMVSRNVWVASPAARMNRVSIGGSRFDCYLILVKISILTRSPGDLTTSLRPHAHSHCLFRPPEGPCWY